ncbi:expressed unknown protein [Seminavis robusta]|uniref:Transmembrane protein n=1 Tax=Seminavis robusta TaxID=568900 RepID=A0A9N8EK71_9STRA|nr:expressed unknown protein [Seminavis robusta]|eukprot:Sro1120_g243340.1 n/a (777) ;mRNA; f:23488-25818
MWSLLGRRHESIIAPPACHGVHNNNSRISSSLLLVLFAIVTFRPCEGSAVVVAQRNNMLLRVKVSVDLDLDLLPTNDDWFLQGINVSHVTVMVEEQRDYIVTVDELQLEEETTDSSSSSNNDAIQVEEYLSLRWEAENCSSPSSSLPTLRGEIHLSYLLPCHKAVGSSSTTRTLLVSLWEDHASLAEAAPTLPTMLTRRLVNLVPTRSTMTNRHPSLQNSVVEIELEAKTSLVWSPAAEPLVRELRGQAWWTKTSLAATALLALVVFGVYWSDGFQGSTVQADPVIIGDSSAEHATVRNETQTGESSREDARSTDPANDDAGNEDEHDQDSSVQSDPAIRDSPLLVVLDSNDETQSADASQGGGSCTDPATDLTNEDDKHDNNRSSSYPSIASAPSTIEQGAISTNRTTDNTLCGLNQELQGAPLQTPPQREKMPVPVAAITGSRASPFHSHLESAKSDVNQELKVTPLQTTESQLLETKLHVQAAITTGRRASQSHHEQHPLESSELDLSSPQVVSPKTDESTKQTPTVSRQAGNSTPKESAGDDTGDNRPVRTEGTPKRSASMPGDPFNTPDGREAVDQSSSDKAVLKTPEQQPIVEASNDSSNNAADNSSAASAMSSRRMKRATPSPYQETDRAEEESGRKKKSGAKHSPRARRLESPTSNGGKGHAIVCPLDSSSETQLTTPSTKGRTVIASTQSSRKRRSSASSEDGGLSSVKDGSSNSQQSKRHKRCRRSISNANNMALPDVVPSPSLSSAAKEVTEPVPFDFSMESFSG